MVVLVPFPMWTSPHGTVFRISYARGVTGPSIFQDLCAGADDPFELFPSRTQLLPLSVGRDVCSPVPHSAAVTMEIPSRRQVLVPRVISLLRQFYLSCPLPQRKGPGLTR